MATNFREPNDSTVPDPQAAQPGAAPNPFGYNPANVKQALTQGFSPQGQQQQQQQHSLDTGLGTGTGTGGLSPEQQLQAQLSWTNTIAEHYLGRDLSYRELLEVQRRGMNPEQLTEQIRSRPSYLPGLTIGQVEDYHTNSKQPFMDWLGREPTDEDIRDLHNRGIVDQDKIDEYVRNRDDVVALHPGAPLNLKDEQYGLQKNAIDSDYLQNLGRTSTHEEARAGIKGRAKGPAPKQEFDVNPEYSQEQGGGLESKTLIAPNARNFA